MSKTDKPFGLAPAFLPNDWHLTEDTFPGEALRVSETLMAQGNGYLGTRGSFEDPVDPQYPTTEGTYLNGVYLRTPIHYDEGAYGLASHNNKMILVPDAKRFELQAGDDIFTQGKSTIERQSRSLDMRDGVMKRISHWKPASGGILEVGTCRFISQSVPGLMAIRYDIRSDGYDGTLSVKTGLDAGYGSHREGFDPRAGELSIADCLDLEGVHRNADSLCTAHRIKQGGHMVLSACRVAIDAPRAVEITSIDGDRFWGTRYDVILSHGDTFSMIKFVYYGDGPAGDTDRLLATAIKALQEAESRGFDALMADQRAAFDAFWEAADVMVGSDDPVQQGLRVGAFHLFQSAGRDGQRALAAKGLSGPGYDGHYFWDTEIYAIPFFIFTQPKVARSLLDYRISKLDDARTRARTMGHKAGALYPWRTIGGEECSSFFPAGTAQYHINAAIAYAALQYLEATDDKSFAHYGGAELLFETARLWMNLGHFSDEKEGRFCIGEVTGPDEYTAMADNNCYTNMMVRHHLRGAATLARRIKAEAPDVFSALAAKIGLGTEEPLGWQQAADAMYVPYDDARGIHEQCDGFLAKPDWDFGSTPAENYPLLLHYHPLYIYRHQVLKQPDVVLAQVLLPDAFSADEKRRNLAYYEPRTTHDSTLSACMHAVAHAESGGREKAYAFFEETYRMDLENRHRNTHYGVHIACMAGSWMAVTYGFAGMRFSGGQLSFNPYLPDGWRHYAFRTRLRDCVLRVRVEQAAVHYALEAGDTLSFLHQGHTVTLQAGTSITLPVA